jgi:hypothetical protein
MHGTFSTFILLQGFVDVCERRRIYDKSTVIYLATSIEWSERILDGDDIVRLDIPIRLLTCRNVHHTQLVKFKDVPVFLLRPRNRMVRREQNSWMHVCVS